MTPPKPADPSGAAPDRDRRIAARPAAAPPARGGRARRVAGLAALLVAVGLVGPLAALAGLAAAPGAGGAADASGGPVLAVAPPWRDLDAIADRAGGRLVGPVQAPFAAFAAGDAPGFDDRLVAAGAWLVLDAKRLVQLCGAAA
ncbi:MAG: hypothetical protein VYD87_06730 [Pseudomonadota bacterium]|nr:hypothetical protein [Pseudomonadota bacterium]